MTFTKRQFRLLLVIYCVLILAGIFRFRLRHRPMTGSDVAALQIGFGLYGLSESQFVFFMLCLLATVLMAWLVGLISAFFLWRPGIYIFLASVCARLVIEHLRHLTPSSGWSLYGGVETIFEFVIIALALCGPAKDLFQRQRETRI